jgi:transcriptional regulator with XRE-family HTH domain
MPQAIAIRNKIIGILLRRARLDAGRTQRECADFLGCSPQQISQYERGQKGPSLPEMEALAYFLDIPPASLWDEHHERPSATEEETLPIEQMLALRRRMIAVQFRQCRLAADLTQKQIAQLLGVSSGMVSQYERGQRDIPFAELELAAEQCGQPLDKFLDDETIPLSNAEQDRQALAALQELSPDVQEFVLKPSNALYLRIAMSLSAIKADELRRIAETLLDITY